MQVLDPFTIVLGRTGINSKNTSSTPAFAVETRNAYPIFRILRKEWGSRSGAPALALHSVSPPQPAHILIDRSCTTR
jgi:hypothetical protein